MESPPRIGFCPRHGRALSVFRSPSLSSVVSISPRIRPKLIWLLDDDHFALTTPKVTGQGWTLHFTQGIELFHAFTCSAWWCTRTLFSNGEEFSLLEMRRVHCQALEVGVASSFGSNAGDPPPNYVTYVEKFGH